MHVLVSVGRPLYLETMAKEIAVFGSESDYALLTSRHSSCGKAESRRMLKCQNHIPVPRILTTNFYILRIIILVKHEDLIIF